MLCDYQWEEMTLNAKIPHNLEQKRCSNQALWLILPFDQPEVSATSLALYAVAPSNGHRACDRHVDHFLLQSEMSIVRHVQD